MRKWGKNCSREKKKRKEKNNQYEKWEMRNEKKSRKEWLSNDTNWQNETISKKDKRDKTKNKLYCLDWLKNLSNYIGRIFF